MNSLLRDLVFKFKIKNYLGFKLHQWQHDYIFKGTPFPEHILDTRGIGKTTAVLLLIIHISTADKVPLSVIAHLDPDCTQNHVLPVLRLYQHELDNLCYRLKLPPVTIYNDYRSTY